MQWKLGNTGYRLAYKNPVFRHIPCPMQTSCYSLQNIVNSATRRIKQPFSLPTFSDPAIVYIKVTLKGKRVILNSSPFPFIDIMARIWKKR